MIKWFKTVSCNKKNKVILIRAGDSGGRLPHALLSLATNLDDEVLILDEATPSLVLKHKDEVKNAICVGISTITGSYIKYSLEVARTIYSINPHIPIIWGGWHPSLKPEQTLENEYVDKVIVGQGELAFRDVVESIKNRKRIDDIIVYEYIDKSKFPVYNFNPIKNMERYIIPYVSPRTITLYTSQGCPFGCRFCAVNSVYGRKYSGWPIESVVDLIDYSIRRYVIDGVHFDDDNFFIGKKRPLEFADQLLKCNIKINWSSDARVDVLCNLEAEEWKMLDRSGCKRLLVGAESGAQATLDRLNKRITPEMILEFGNLCNKYNIIPCFSMMVGVPGETQKNIEETFKLIDILKKKVPASELLLFLYTPYPGTPLYKLSLEMGFKEPQSLESWSEFYLDVPTVPWVDEDLVERVRKYNKSLPLHRDISLKHKEKFRFNSRIYIHRIQNLISRFNRAENKKEALLRYLKRRLLKGDKKDMLSSNFNPSYIGRRDDILNLIPIGVKKVLDIGCSIGILGEQIKQRNNAEVIGIELDEQMAEIAKEKLDRVIVGDIEQINLEDYLLPNYFDCIVFADILEHLKNPWHVLKRAVSFLRNDGVIIASIPNIRHYTTIITLVIKGYWPYRERGIHDRTHLRFFTLRNIKEMFQEAGLRIVKIERNYRIIEKPHRYNKFSKFFAFSILRDLLTFQYLIVGKKNIVRP